MSGDRRVDLCEQVAHCAAAGLPLVICGGGSKATMLPQPPAEAMLLDMQRQSGIIDYQPTELMLRARAGTPVSDITRLLAGEGQMLGFEPPTFDNRATLGGTLAMGLSGARRPWSGSARDFVLGVGLITGEGRYLEFGGQVMKNVAGFDVSRLSAGARGTLGVIADVSLKVLPLPEAEMTLVLACSRDAALPRMLEISNSTTPVSGLCHIDGHLFVRLSGSASAVAAARSRLGGEGLASGQVWSSVAELTHKSLAGARCLWRISVPPASNLLLAESTILDWGGAQRFVADPARHQLEVAGSGHALQVRGPGAGSIRLPNRIVAAISARLAAAFDPAAILNPHLQLTGGEGG
ncbi:MAG: glycolate oxidase subunit GlcE [Pseudomonadota bacterium]